MVEHNPIELLVDGAKEGDRAAFDELVQIHQSRLKTFVQSRIGSDLKQSLDAEDVLQDAFVRSFELIDRFTWKGEESFFRWLTAIAGHLIWNASQKRCRDTLRLVTDIPGGVSPSRVVRREERFERLQSAVEELTPDQKKAVIFARIDGLRIKEIARRMDRSPEAVKQLLTRALKQLRSSFGDTESLHLPDKSLQAGGERDV